MLIIRLFFKDIVEQEVRSLRGKDLFSFIGSTKSYNVKEYKIIFKGLIVQEPSGKISLIRPGANIRLVEGLDYCKWHNGPLDRKDDPLKREYCTNLSRSSLGYCLKHLRSDRALYDRCVSGMGDEALKACELIDKKYTGLEHVVYLIVLPTGKVKVGITRKFRIYERIAEQQHILATILTTTKSALEARKIELKISSETRVSDKGLRDLVKKAHVTLEQACNVLESVVANIKRDTGLKISLENIDNGFFRIIPSKYLMRAEEMKKLNSNGEFIIRDYWGGYLFLEDHNGRVYAVKTTRILHKKSLTIL